MEVQHVNVKIFAREPVDASLDAAIPVFHRWIQQRLTGHMLIDVADYRHVPEGPGVVLIALEAHFALDMTGGRLGLLYNRRKAGAGDAQAKLGQAYSAALAACEQLEREPELRGKLQFERGDVEVIFNDRYFVPNNAESYAALEPELRRFFAGLWGEASFDLQHVGEPRDRLRVRATLKQPALAG